MSIPLAWESYSFPQPLGESVRAVLIYNEWKSERTEEVGGGGRAGGGGDNRISENSVCVSYFFFRFIPLHGGA